ncbi:MAG: hypothetical protein HXY18_18995 [Bryobacteraceae bacterium]|nr:hypothetical protein [Bryobacteraceae bacterium]
MSDSLGTAGRDAQEQTRAQLERVLASHALAGSDQLKRLLRVVVERTLNGQSEMLKEYNLGLEVFQRPPDYDPKVDPIVRVQARRLRAKLEEFYAGEGAGDPIVIQIPKGAYVPLFEPRTHAAKSPAPPRRRGRAVLAAAFAALAAMVALVWAASENSRTRTDVDLGVAVLPLKIFSENGSGGHIANQVTEVLTTALAKNTKLRVVSRTTASQYGQSGPSLPEIARALGVRWVVEGGVGMEGAPARM